MKRFGWGLAVMLSLVACDTQENQMSQPGRLDAQWTGADTGKISSHATAEWCSDRLWLELRAIQGDTGLAIALYPLDSIVSDSYPVLQPTQADSARPSASLALRLFAPTAIKGYRGDSGAVFLVHSSSGHVSGTIAARARAVTNGEPIQLSGKFERVTILPQGRGCAPEPPDSASDTTEAAEPLNEQVD